VQGLTSYIAIGDSFTEGLNDPGPDGHYRGWADRLAGILADGQPDFRYANLAVRGKYLRQVLSEQLPIACQVRADLVTFCAGGNDLLRPGGDPDRQAELFEEGVRKLLAAGSQVLVFTGFDTVDTPLLRRVRGRIATYNGHLRAIADRHGCQVVDLWSMRVLRNKQAWSEDRLHLAPAGHQRVALRVAELLGVPADGDWNEPWPEAAPPAWLDLRRSDLKWAREHFVPWLGRHLRGRSSGDGLPPKRPELTPMRIGR